MQNKHTVSRATHEDIRPNQRIIALYDIREKRTQRVDAIRCKHPAVGQPQGAAPTSSARTTGGFRMVCVLRLISQIARFSKTYSSHRAHNAKSFASQTILILDGMNKTNHRPPFPPSIGLLHNTSPKTLDKFARLKISLLPATRHRQHQPPSNPPKQPR